MGTSKSQYCKNLIFMSENNILNRNILVSNDICYFVHDFSENYTVKKLFTCVYNPVQLVINYIYQETHFFIKKKMLKASFRGSVLDIICIYFYMCVYVFLWYMRLFYSKYLYLFNTIFCQFF